MKKYILPVLLAGLMLLSGACEKEKTKGMT